MLNKIDALADPLATREAVDAQIEQQRQTTAETLGVASERVFALSAREALAARVEGNGCRAGASCWCSRPWAWCSSCACQPRGAWPTAAASTPSS